jgi:xanthine/CO dehydrogenase XdhC/CoxF family maturation factor
MTDERAAMITLAKRLLASGTAGTLSTLFSARGSTYRTLGSMMVSLPGMRAGGVSGGCLEEYVTRVGASQCDEGSTLACRVMRTGESLSVTREWLRSDCRPASDPDLLVHYIPPVTRLLIFGAGDDAMPLCDIGASLGWHVSVVDRRTRLATAARFPNARAVVANEWEEAVDAVVFSPRAAAVLMTHSLDDDARVLALLSRRQLSYLGALGPAHRRQWLIDQASAYDATHGDQIAMKVHGPIGLDLGDRSAAGIALAVAAEILARLNHRDAKPLHHAGEVSGVDSHRGGCLVA